MVTLMTLGLACTAIPMLSAIDMTPVIAVTRITIYWSLLAYIVPRVPTILYEFLVSSSLIPLLLLLPRVFLVFFLVNSSYVPLPLPRIQSQATQARPRCTARAGINTGPRDGC